MSRPSDQELRKAYQAKNKNQRRAYEMILEKHPDANYHTIRARMLGLGLPGQGKGGTKTLHPGEDTLRALYEAHDGHVTNMAAELGVAQATVSGWIKGLGLLGNGKFGFKPIYPVQLQYRIKNGAIVVYSDAHFWPMVKSRAYDAMLVAFKKIKPKAIICNGDLLDGARISRHEPIGWDDLPKFEDELHECKIRQAEIARAAPGADKFGVIGNHDVRFEKYLIKNARELEGIEGTRLAHHFPNWQICWSLKINDDVIVKHRFKGGTHATYNNTLHAGTTIVTGHLHCQNVRAKTDYRGTRYGIDPGCLADVDGPQFLYLEANPVDWRSGFVVLEFENGVLLPPQLATVLDDGSVYIQRNERLM